ncbi:MAG TPA: hypothetical protein VIK57_22850 [Streptosporangiaceae bacterium]
MTWDGGPRSGATADSVQPSPAGSAARQNWSQQVPRPRAHTSLIQPNGSSAAIPSPSRARAGGAASGTMVSVTGRSGRPVQARRVATTRPYSAACKAGRAARTAAASADAVPSRSRSRQAAATVAVSRACIGPPRPSSAPRP